jgi:predicted alpha-1,2-mannosidase
MKHCCYLFLFILFFTACSLQTKQAVDYVDPFIGTDFHGHTYPGATVPHGAVQLSPDTRKGNWDACSGYHYSDNTITGFSHTHLSGTGCMDLGDILFHPTTQEVYHRPSGYFFDPLTFSHKDETAVPGYYSVKFKQEGIKAELTATTYAGVHRYTYDKGKNQQLVVDLMHLLGEETIDSVYAVQRTDNEIAGMRRTQGWTPNQYVFFVAQFSDHFQSADFIDNNVILNFGVSKGKPIIAKVGLSVVSEENARENLAHDVSGFDFDAVRRQAYESWNEALSDILVEGTKEDMTIFYTAQYHTKIVPNVVSDVNGDYRRNDMRIVRIPPNEKRYSTFSLWDTYRAWNPLVALTDPQLVTDMIRSFLDMYDATGELPIWPLSAGETFCMIGYHSVSVIADAWMKGIRDFDIEKAFKAMKVSSNINQKGSDYYVKNGFIPSNIKNESVSCLLEYAYDDWCIAQIAKELKKENEYKEYMQRALSYVNVFDSYTKFFRGKRSDGNWDSPFNRFSPGHAYTEATAWQYRFYVPHDINGLVQLFGCKESFIEQLDSLFIVESKIDGEQSDITGLIGQYVHGNEPSHHMAYLYNYVGQPWKTQAMTRRIIREMYQPTPEGIVGNEDCGQMSAWYVWSSLGLYPVCPGSNEWVLTTPVFPKSMIHLPDGKTLEIKSNNSGKNGYIDQVILNEHVIENNYVTYEQLKEGGTLEFILSNRPNLTRGVVENTYPYSLTKELKVSLH